MRVRIKRNFGIQRHRIKRRMPQDRIRGLVYLILFGFFTGVMLYTLEPKIEQIRYKEKGTFEVVDGLEIHEEIQGVYKIDALLPQIVSDLEYATDLNAEIATDFYYLYDCNSENVLEAFSGWKNPKIGVSYQVNKRRGVYDIAITTKVSSIYAYNPLTIDKHYFYDEKKQAVIK